MILNNIIRSFTRLLVPGYSLYLFLLPGKYLYIQDKKNLRNIKKDISINEKGCHYYP